jgi:two-component system, LytTR family, sensor kinase
MNWFLGNDKRPMPQSRPSDASDAKARRWRLAALQFAFWTFIGVLSTSQYYSLFRFENEPLPLWRLILWQMPGWYLWGALTPFILLLGKRFRVERTRPLTPVAIHLVIGALTSLAHLSVTAYFRWASRPMTRPFGPLPYVNVWVGLFAGLFHIDLLIYFVILGVGYWFEFYRKYRERELVASQLEKQLAQAQLEALKMQLHPHFLFNTLHAISVLVRKHESQMAVRMISGLSDLLRHILRQSGAPEVAFKQEMDFIEQYLEFEQLRFQDRMIVQINAAPETLDARVPNLILQPLVENAIRHGIAAKADATIIEIRSWRNHDKLWIEVRDDGPGIDDPSQIMQGPGLGLKNTLARLKRHYGEAYSFELENVESGGAIVKVGIPFNQSPDTTEHHYQ